jgi:serine/threonine protein kinase
MNSSTDILTAGTEQLGLQLARELRRRWHNGEHISAEQLLAGNPELSQHPEAAIDLIYEEYCLREAAGQTDVEQDLLRRFPQWGSQLRVMLDCHRRLIDSEHVEPQFPAVGERVGDFALTSELARGSRGRVFLAVQTALADRPVVLKLTALDGTEHVSLARLQHTNIVPLYSVSDDLRRGIRALCMPFFGRATLASLLAELTQVPLAQRSGRDIVDAMDRMHDPSSPAPASAARQMLASVSYVQAMCWITACLADALQFAHERELVHLDLKPSNVLLATDGQPMLLDFHLAREPIRAGGPAPESFGGTPPYMPPEQLAAMQALRSGKPIEVNVDGRADVYALGAILYEALGGRLPVAMDSPPLTRLNPHVSRGLSDILDKCLADRADARYAEAQGLADDLRRHLTDQPLSGVSNQSLWERWRKWRRRRPATLRTLVMLLVVVTALAALLTGAALHLHDRHDQAKVALLTASRQMQSGHDLPEAIRTLDRGIALLKHVPFENDLRQELQSQLATAKALELSQQLHRVADEIRVTYGGTDAITPGRQRTLAERCDAFWQKRSVILQKLGTQDPQVQRDLMEIAIFAASLRAGSAVDSAAVADAHREALRILDEAFAAFGGSTVLEYERQIHLRALRQAPPPTIPAPRTVWEHYALGRALLGSGDLQGASEELAAALKEEPAALWPNFHAGLCAHRLGRYHDAVTHFSVCIGSEPNAAGHFYNRAISYTALERIDLALSDYDRAIEIDPSHAAALLNRGALYLQKGQLAAASADFHRALEQGADPAAVHYDLALLHEAASDPSAAARHLQLCLKHDPKHEDARRLYERMQHRVE